MNASYLYDLDERPPLHLAILYGMQWAFIMFPAVIIAATLGVNALQLDSLQEIRFLQFTLLTSGFFTAFQTLWGHRYPLLEGPSTALVLTFILLAPYGLPAIQGGMIAGGILLTLTVLSGQLKRVTRLFTPNVVGVVLMLVALGLLRPLLTFMAGAEGVDSQGDSLTFLISLGLVLFMATLSYRLDGFWKSVSLLVGMAAGSLLFLGMGRLPWEKLATPPWLSFITPLVPGRPWLFWPVVVAFAFAYLAVIVNSIGSLQGVASVTDPERLNTATTRGILINGLAGIFCGLFGVVGTVSYSTSPGVILVLRVASRYAVTYCGLVLLLAAFLPKLAALLALVPKPVVGAALCVALGAQIGVGITTVTAQGLTSRDYFVVGLPLLIGTMVGFLPSSVMAQFPGPLQVFMGNGLVVGIVLVLILEHLLLRKRHA